MSKTIILTHFWDGKNFPKNDLHFSIAESQPAWAGFPVMTGLVPVDTKGNSIRLGRVDAKGLADDEYRRVYEEEVLYTANATNSIKQLVDMMKDGERAVLCCYCNFLTQQEHSLLACHRILVGYRVEELYPEMMIVYAGGAEKPVWERRK